MMMGLFQKIWHTNGLNNMKKMIKMVLVSSLLLCLVGCGEKYEDTNGSDNYNLQTIRDSEIIELSVGASGLSYTESEVAGITSKEYSAKNFNGVDRIYHTNFILPSDIRIEVGYVSVKEGNFRVCIINDEKIIDEIPVDAFAQSFYYENLSGDFSIHIAGESAKFEMNIEVW